MYGFHKINRTPRNVKQASSSAHTAPVDPASQKWEFSHPKFLRGRSDLLEDIKRKTIDVDPNNPALPGSTTGGRGGRLELPAEVARQLREMSEEYSELVKELRREKEKNAKLSGMVKILWDGMKTGSLLQNAPSLPPFPVELLERSNWGSDDLATFTAKVTNGVRTMKLAGNGLVPVATSRTGSADIDPQTPTPPNSSGLTAANNRTPERGRRAHLTTNIRTHDSDTHADKRTRIEDNSSALHMSTTSRRRALKESLAFTDSRGPSHSRRSSGRNNSGSYSSGGG